MKSKKMWITWEWQRRSIELSKALNCRLYIIEYKGLLRYLKCIIATIRALKKKPPDILFVQNPSMILATFACTYKIIKKIILIVDRHSTFGLAKRKRIKWKHEIHKILSNFTIKHADLTIVTNKYLGNIVKSKNGRPFILPDKIPTLSFTEKIELKGKNNILLISSFGYDEPIKEVLDAMKKFRQKDFYLYITGNTDKL